MAVLLGAADAGKTTLTRLIAGQIPRFTGGEVSGSIELHGQSLNGTKPYELLERVGVVSQDSNEQIITARCDTEVAFALESLGLPRQQIVQRVDEALDLLGLSGFRERNPSTLSGGEKKRLLAACLLAIRPPLWILDECLAELDTAWRVRVLDLAADRGTTVLALDARCPEVLLERGSTFSVLAGGRISVTSERPDAPRLRSNLSSEGLLAPRARASGRSRSATCLSLESIRFHFGQSFALRIEHLELSKGSLTALVGPNGSGKSTLGRILCGLLPPDSGRVFLDTGSGPRAASSRELNRAVGYLFQNPDHQIYLPTIREELALGLRRVGLSAADLEARIQEAIERFALPDQASPPALLSFGARRRLQAATYFLLKREILILDEVDAGLSYGELDSLLDALSAGGSGILLITHDPAVARASCDRVLMMHDGEIRENPEAAP